MRAWDPNLRPQFTQQWNVFAEYLLTASCRPTSATSATTPTHLVTPVEGNQPLPGVGDPVDLGAARSTRRPLFATAPLITNISTTAARGRSDYNALQASLRQRNVNGFEYLASYTLGQVQTNNLGYYGSAGVAAEGAYWMNTYEPEWNYGPAFFDARHNFVFSANYELPFGRDASGAATPRASMDAILGGWRLSGIFQARTGFPITVIDGSAPSLQGMRGNERPNCVGDPVPSDQSITPLAGHRRVPARAARHVGQLRHRRRPRAGLSGTSTLVLAKRFNAGGERYFEFRAEAFNLTNTPSFGPPARDINAPNTFGTDHEHGEAPRGPWSWC